MAILFNFGLDNLMYLRARELSEEVGRRAGARALRSIDHRTTYLSFRFAKLNDRQITANAMPRTANNVMV